MCLELALREFAGLLIRVFWRQFSARLTTELNSRQKMEAIYLQQYFPEQFL
jgi:hypothetical protein